MKGVNETIRELFEDTLKIDLRGSDTASPEEARELVQRLDTLKAESADNQSKTSRSLWVFGGLLTLGGLAAVVASLTGFGASVPDALLFTSFVVSLVALGVYAASFDESRRKKAEKRLVKLHKRMMKGYEKQLSGKVAPEVDEPVIAGVAAQLAKRLGIPVGIVRIIMLALIPITGGVMLPAYAVMAMIMPKEPKR